MVQEGFGLEEIWGSTQKIEVCLMNKRRVNVFQIPPAASAKGHCTEDWRGKQMWTGYCQIMHEAKSCCRVQLVNEDDSLFA